MDLNVAAKALQECQALAGLSEEQRGLLLLRATQSDCAAGQTVYREGDRADSRFSLLTTGSVEILRDDGDVVKSLDAPVLLGEVGAVNPQGVRTFTVRADSEVSLLSWSLDELQADLPSLAEALRAVAWDHGNAM